MSDSSADSFFGYNGFKSNQIFPNTNNIYVKKAFDSNKPFEVIWKDLTYRVRHWFGYKTILNNNSGSFRSGQIMAIMGPSGCGKSSLLGCLSRNKKKGVSGSITISTKQKVKFAFITQDDYLENRLSVRESLRYASKLKNKGDIDHKVNVENVMKRLDIEMCANVRAKRCSGGQRKRISIALELVSRPNILILDEPTSGLDSVTTWQLINTLIDLTEQTEPMAIVATIHQPSGKLFYLFNTIYIMSFDGQGLYQGSPLAMVNFLAQYGLKCPVFHNPSDYVLEVAAKEHGIGKTMLLSTIMKIDAMDLKPHQNQIQPRFQYRTCSQTWSLTKRNFKLTIRDPLMLPIRIISHIVIVTMVTQFWGSESGKLSGCPDNFIVNEGSYSENFARVADKLNENFACIAFLLLNVWFGAIFSVLLTFPQEMNIFLKEYRNGWYSCFSYYMSKVLVDLVFQLTIPNLMSIPGYILSGQYYEGQEWRLHYFIFLCIILALTSTSMGLMVSAWLMKYPTAAAFIGIVLIFPLFLLSDFLIPIKDMPEMFQWVSYGSFIRYAIQSGTIVVYGFNRCDSDKAYMSSQNRTDWSQMIPNEAINKIMSSDKFNGLALISTLSFFSGQTSSDSQSIIMRKLEYEDNDLYFSLAMLILIMIAFKVFTYFVILRKVKTIE